MVILNIRPAKSAQNYAKIWDSFGKGSPLLNITLLQAQGVEKILTNKFDNLTLEVGMRYGNPSIDLALEKLQAKGCEKIVVLPLYPQYSDTTTGSTLDAINKILDSWDNRPKLDFIDDYYTDKGYIQSLALSVIEHQKQHGKPDKLIVSFHGIPQRFVDNGDIYYEHCVNTSVLLAEALNLQDKDYQLCFQSIFGREEWIKPQTKVSLESLAQDGVEHIQVHLPWFLCRLLRNLGRN